MTRSSVEGFGGEQVAEALVVVAEQVGEHVDGVLAERRRDAGDLGGRVDERDAPLRAGQPGYETPRLDRDGDGIACE